MEKVFFRSKQQGDKSDATREATRLWNKHEKFWKTTTKKPHASYRSLSLLPYRTQDSAVTVVFMLGSRRLALFVLHNAASAPAEQHRATDLQIYRSTGETTGPSGYPVWRSRHGKHTFTHRNTHTSQIMLGVKWCHLDLQCRIYIRELFRIKSTLYLN